MGILLAIAKFLFGFVEKRQSERTERLRIETGLDIKRLDTVQELHKEAGSIVRTGMQHKWFWIPWSMAAVPLAAWFGWGVMDSLLNGALPDVATLPPQLKEYADIVWSNIFYSGAAVGSASIIGRAILRR